MLFILGFNPPKKIKTPIEGTRVARYHPSSLEGATYLDPINARRGGIARKRRNGRFLFRQQEFSTAYLFKIEEKRLTKRNPTTRPDPVWGIRVIEIAFFIEPIG
jgi:hypothetical protein